MISLKNIFRARKNRHAQSDTRRRRGIVVESLENRSLMATFAVTNVDDFGAGSLREAILEANQTPNGAEPDQIVFAIPGNGTHVIQPRSALPFITEPLTLDGYTQVGSSPNTNPLSNASNAVHNIQIDGSQLPSGAQGLVLSGGNSTITGIHLANIPQNGIVMFTNGDNVISGNEITGVQGFAVQVLHGSGNRVGGPTPADRNVISGNGVGVHLFCGEAGQQPHGCPAGAVAEETLVQGNFIGVGSSGTLAMGNREVGIRIDGARNNLIGGIAPARATSSLTTGTMESASLMVTATRSLVITLESTAQV